MKFFYGNIKKSKIEWSKYNIYEKYKDFYGCNYKGEVTNIENDLIRYCELNNQRYNDKFNNEIYIFGDIDLLILNNEIIDFQLAYKEIERLYREKGLNLIYSIKGQFSIIIIDTRKAVVHLIKDHLGSRPLYYLNCNDNIVFASDLYLMSSFIKDKKNGFNIEYFKEYCSCMGNVNSGNTPYKEIYKVESGSIVSISYKDNKENEKNIINYWNIDELNKKIDCDENQIIQKFKNIFIKSIENRIKVNQKIGVMMSGGLDSTSIYAIIKGILKKKATVVTAIYNKLKLCDERKYSNQVTTKYPDEIVEVVCDRYGLFYGYPEEDYFTYEPHVNALSLKLTEELIKQASYANVDILFDGYAADHILGGTLSGAINDLKKMDIRKMYRSIKQYSLKTNSGFIQNLNKFIIKPIINKNVPELDENLNKFYNKKFKKVNDLNKKQLIIQISSANAYSYADRIIAPRYNIEMEHPFLDKDIIEFLYSIDYKYRLNEKYNKYVLRESMRDILPEQVRTKITKTENVSLSYIGIIEKWNEIYPMICNFSIGEFGVVDLSKEEWIEQIYKYRNGQTVRDDFLVLLTLELWINNFKWQIN